MPIEFNALSSSRAAEIMGKTRSVKKIEIPEIDGGSDYEPPLTEAIRLYRNFVLTGVKELTSDEKEEIKSKIEEYMEENNFLDKYRMNQASKEDYTALNSFIQGLYKQFGSCADYYEFVSDYVEGKLEAVVDPSNPPLPPFKVKIPPEHAQEMENMKKKPMLAAFQSPSPHQFLMGADSPSKA